MIGFGSGVTVGKTNGSAAAEAIPGPIRTKGIGIVIKTRRRIFLGMK
jgi:hypothetical protein